MLKAKMKRTKTQKRISNIYRNVWQYLKNTHVFVVSVLRLVFWWTAGLRRSGPEFFLRHARPQSLQVRFLKPVWSFQDIT